MKKRKKYKKIGLPRHVILKQRTGAPRGVMDWHVRVSFATNQRSAAGKVIYDQCTRKCEPETAERAAELVEWLKQEYNEAKAGVPKIGRAVGSFLEYYLHTKVGSVTRRTQEFYEDLFERHIKSHAISQRILDDLTTLDLQTFFNSIDASPQRKKKIRILLTMAFNQAVIWEMIRKNPAKGLLLPKVTPQEAAAFTEDEARRIAKVCASEDRFFVFAFALETGLRPQETIGIRWKDVDLSKRKISVRQAIAQGYAKGGFEVKEPKTGASKRTIGISSHLCDLLKKHREAQNQLIAKIRADFEAPLQTQKRVQGANYQARKARRQLAKEKLEAFAKYDLVFPALNGKPLSKNNVNRREFKEVLKLAGIDPKKGSMETLRHTCLTLLANHLNPKKLQRHAGHSQLSTTLNYYVHVNDGSQFEGSDKVAEMLY